MKKVLRWSGEEEVISSNKQKAHISEQDYNVFSKD